jgi:hypothetical protein
MYMKMNLLQQALKEEIWPLPTTLQEKLYGPMDALQKTTRFVPSNILHFVAEIQKKKKILC